MTIKNVYPLILCRYTCRGLFEVHKLLFSFQMCAKILEVAGKLNMDEYSFFLRGGLVRTHGTHTNILSLPYLIEHNLRGQMFYFLACLLSQKIFQVEVMLQRQAFHLQCVFLSLATANRK